jgi:hypothetical protein
MLLTSSTPADALWRKGPAHELAATDAGFCQVTCKRKRKIIFGYPAISLTFETGLLLVGAS